MKPTLQPTPQWKESGYTMESMHASPEKSSTCSYHNWTTILDPSITFQETYKVQCSKCGCVAFELTMRANPVSSTNTLIYLSALSGSLKSLCLMASAYLASTGDPMTTNATSSMRRSAFPLFGAVEDQPPTSPRSKKSKPSI